MRAASGGGPESPAGAAHCYQPLIRGIRGAKLNAAQSRFSLSLHLQNFSRAAQLADFSTAAGAAARRGAFLHTERVDLVGAVHRVC